MAEIDLNAPGGGSMTEEEEQAYKLFIIVSAVFALLTCIVSLHHYLQYRKHWTQPRTQTLVLRVMFIVPFWAVMSFIISIVPDDRYYLAIPMDFYEGFAILTFMQLIYWYLGGKEQARIKAENKTSFRTCLGLWHVIPGENFMRFVHICIYQFAFTRPTWSIVAAILYSQGMFDKGEMDPLTVALTILLYVCLGVAMWALFQVYRVFRVVLAPYNTGSKFLAIKFYVFLHALQGFVFTQLEKNQKEGAAVNLGQAQYSLLTVEMFIGALLNYYVFFNTKEYVTDDTVQNTSLGETLHLRSKHTYSRVEERPEGVEDTKAPV